ncbi:MAG: non-homologous end-joining DNA ligase [Methanothrix sp.]|nr:non-homologous end-joining DNA ligase [Methanothrix sp.]
MNPIRPMLAVSGRPFSSEGWIFEPKIDGTRCIASIMDGVELWNRRLMSISYRYPEVVRALADTAPGSMLDGEIAVFIDDRPDFAALSKREHQGRALGIEYLSYTMPASYIVFDILYASGEPVMGLPLSRRKRLLSEAVEESETVVLADSFPEHGEEYFRAALEMGIEGVMAKRLQSLYQPGTRSQDWIKIKKRLKLDLVVGGYIPGRGDREPYFGGLLLGAYNEGRLVYLGRVGSGFSSEELQEIARDLVPSADPPFTTQPAVQDARWVKPEMVVQVAALEVTEEGHLRAPVFLRRRDDKEPGECHLDQLQSKDLLSRLP